MLSPDRSNFRTRAPGEDNLVLRRSGVSSSQGADDTAFVRELAHRTFLAYGSYDRYLEDWIRNEAVSTYLAEVDRKRAGFYMSTTYRDADASNEMIADLVAIAVAPEYRSRGVGKRLLAHAAASAAEADPPARQMWLVVAEGNARARRFFTRHGFHLREGVGVYPAGQRALRMVRSLKGG
jgi:ribosomal protein S18 acetylase RimI-like enzyme